MHSLSILSWAEIVKLLKRRLNWVLLVLLIVIQGLRIDNLYGHTFDEPPREVTPITILPEDYWQAVILPGIFERARLSYDWLSIFMILMATMMMGQEFTWGTMRTCLARGTGRARLLFAKFVALAAVAALFLFILWIASGVSGLFTTIGLERRVDWSFLDGAFLVHEFAALARTWIVVWPSIALALFVAAWTRNPGLSLALVELLYGLNLLLSTFSGLLGIYLTYFVEAGLDPRETSAGIWGMLVTLIPRYNTIVVVHWGQLGKLAELEQAMLFPAEVLNLPRDPWRCMALLLGYGFGAIILALWVFRRKDITV